MREKSQNWNAKQKLVHNTLSKLNRREKNFAGSQKNQTIKEHIEQLRPTKGQPIEVRFQNEEMSDLKNGEKRKGKKGLLKSRREKIVHINP